MVARARGQMQEIQPPRIAVIPNVNRPFGRPNGRWYSRSSDTAPPWRPRPCPALLTDGPVVQPPIPPWANCTSGTGDRPPLAGLNIDGFQAVEIQIWSTPELRFREK